MFTILHQDFNGRKYDRYFHNWDNAKKEMNKSIENTCKTLGGRVVGSVDRMNHEKGFYMYEKTAIFPNGEQCVWTLIDAYFEDEE